MIEFIKNKREVHAYKKICKELRGLNVDKTLIDEGYRSFNLNSKIGDLEYKYRSDSETESLSYNGKVLFETKTQRPDYPLAEKVYEKGQQEWLTQFISENINKGNVIKKDEAIKMYQDIAEKMLNNDNTKITEDIGVKTKTNNIGNLSIELEDRTIGKKENSIIVIKNNEDVIFKQAINKSKTNIICCKTSECLNANQHLENKLNKLTTDRPRNKNRI